MVLDEIIERPCLGRPAEGPTQGVDVDYEFTGPLVFGAPLEEGLRCRLPFESRGVSSGQCPTSENAQYTFARDGVVLGTVLVELGPEALKLSKIREILDGTIIEIVIDNVDIDDLRGAAISIDAFAGEA